MGAYNAVKLLKLYSLESLVLFRARDIRPTAYAVPFGDEFSKVIRQPHCWFASDTWSILHTFIGRLLIVAAQKDTMIPPEFRFAFYCRYFEQSVHFYRDAFNSFIVDDPDEISIHIFCEIKQLKKPVRENTCVLEICQISI